MVYFNYSVTLRQLNDLPGSINAMRAALKVDPLFGPAHINLGRAYEDAGAAPQAIQQWKNFVEATDESTADRVSYRFMALQHIGRVMENAGLLEEAETVLWQAMELRPDKPETGQHWSAIRQRQCKWPILVPSSHITMRQMVDAMSPLTLGCYSDDPMFQLARAYVYNKGFVGRLDIRDFPRGMVKQKTGTGERLRVGYVSSDLRDHAVGFALREVLEFHNKASVEIHAYYCGDPVANDETQTRMKAAVDGWHDIGALTDEAAARQIASDEIDILIDVNGYTKHARTKIFAYRPAPVIVNFCGYPGSMGSPFHQYMIADAQIVPVESEIYYSEKCCASPAISRLIASAPLPKSRPAKASVCRKKAFVFACFNGMQKITSGTFDQWVKILTATPDSILWLLSGNEKADQRLKDLAQAAGIAPERIILPPNPAMLNIWRVSRWQTCSSTHSPTVRIRRQAMH